MKPSENIDVVYVLKNDIDPEELRYSLRSVEENFPHGKVWFFGGIPEGIVPDRQVEVIQKGKTPYEKTSRTWEVVCKTEEVSDDFWLFNDDFFVLRKVDDVQPMYSGTLKERYEGIEKRKQPNKYTRMLRRTIDALTNDGYATKSYTLHVPMLINKEKALKLFKQYGYNISFRSMYGNVYEVGGLKRADIKIVALDTLPNLNRKFLSTSNDSFNLGVVGQFIRNRFTHPCKYEKDIDYDYQSQEQDISKDTKLEDAEANSEPI